MKKILLTLFFLAFFLFFFALAKDSNAQTCSGITPKCRTQVVTTCVTSTGASCVRGSPGCICTESCSGGTRWTCNACSDGTTSALCSSISRCDSIDSCLCVESGGCSWTSAPTCTINCSGTYWCDTNCDQWNTVRSCPSNTCVKGSTLIANNTSSCNGVGGLTCPKVDPPPPTCVAGTGPTNASCGGFAYYAIQPSSGLCCEYTYRCVSDTCTAACHNNSIDQSLCGGGISCPRCNASNTCENYTYTGGPTCPTTCNACPGGGGGGTCLNTKLKFNPKTG